MFSDNYSVVTCATDGVTLDARTHDGLERLWDLHRGLTPETIRARQVRGVMASDEEVSDFLKHLDDPRYVSHYGAEPVALPSDGLEDAFDLLDKVRMLKERCTCTTTAVEACPNYTEGDELE